MPRLRLFLCLQLGLVGFLVLALVMVLMPRATYAQTTTENYQPQSIEEFIAYLYGIVAILEAQIKAEGGVVSSGTKSDIVTLSPTSVDEDDATLRGEVSMGTSDYAYLYFEYGTDSSLDDETERVKTNNTSKVKSFSAEIDDLREDRKYYYRAVAKLPNGKYLYGTTRSFSTDDDNDEEDEDEDEDDGDYRGDGDIELDDDSYKVGETIEVEVDAPSSVELGYGWIALFAVGSSDSAYIGTKQYVTKRDQSFNFSTPRFPGKYEFRLFEDAGFNLESRSETFEIE